MKKWTLGFLIFAAITGLLWIASPFRNNRLTGEYTLENQIIIAAPAEKVFTYLGQSANASQWSSFVDHITPLNPEQVPDGQIGSSRRCFRNADETGIQWDEDILGWEANRFRELSIYNMKHFQVATDELRTRQRYEPLGADSVTLTFGLYKKSDKTTLTDLIKMKYAGYVVAWIFDANMQNIKKETEKP